MSDQSLAVRGDVVATPTTNAAKAYLMQLRSAGSRSVMRRKLDACASRYFGSTWDSMPWHELTFVVVEGIITKELERVAPSTVNGLLAAIKGVIRAAWRLDQLDGETYWRIKDIKSVKGGSTGPAGRYVTVGEREALIRACDGSSQADQRDASILLLLCAGGLRRAEVAALDLAEILEDDPETETMTLQVQGKGRKQRTIYLNNGGRDALLDWVAMRGEAPGPLYWHGVKAGKLEAGQRLSPQGIYDVLRKRAAQAGVKRLTPHDLRRSWVSDLPDSGTDISTVAALAGHASVVTTQRYDRRGERAKKKAARTLHFAYRRREAVAE